MSRLTVTYLAHASVVLDFGGGAVLLTNPCLSKKSGGQACEPALAGRLAGILITRFEPGLADLEGLPESFSRKLPVAVPAGCGPAAAKAGFPNAVELAPGEDAVFGAVQIHAAPAAPDDRISAVIQAGGLSVFFGGDTLFEPRVATVPKSFPLIDLAILPVGGAAGGVLSRKKACLSAQEAAGLCAVLKPLTAIPILCGADPGSPEAFDRAARIFSPETRVLLLKPGEFQSLPLAR